MNGHEGRRAVLAREETSETRVMDPLLQPEEVAEFYAVPELTLTRWRAKGTGPRYFRVGRHVRYRREDVEAWLEEQAAVR